MAFIGGAIAGFIGLTGAAANIAGAAINAGLALGLNYAVSALTSKSRRAARRDRRKASDFLVTLTGTVEPRFICYGRLKVAGLRVFSENRSGFQYQAHVFGTGTIDYVEEWFINNRRVEVDADGCVTTKPWLIRESKPATTRSHLRIDLRRGHADQEAAPLLTTAFPGQWTTEHRGRGLVYAVFQMKFVSLENYQKYWNSGDVAFAMTARHALLYDPRDGLMSLSDASRWRYSDNAALAVLNYALFGAQIAPAAFDMIAFGEAASICGETVPLKSGGVEPRYAIAYRASLGDAPADVLRDMMAACRGRLSINPQGQIRLRCGPRRAARIEVDASMVIEISELRRGQSLLTRYNAMRGVYVSEPHGWTPQPCAIQRDWRAFGQDGNRQILEETDFPSVTSQTQAQRLAKQELYEENPEWTGEIKLSPRALELIEEETFLFTHPVVGRIECAIASMTLDQDDQGRLLGLSLSFESINREGEAWNPAVDEGEPPVVPPNTSEDPAFPAPPTGLAAVAETVSGSVRAGIRANPTNRAGDTFDVWFRPVAGGDWEQIDGAAGPFVLTGVLSSGVNYEAKMRVRTKAGGISDWTSPVNFTATGFVAGSLVAPTGLTVSAGSEEISFSATQSAGAQAFWLDYDITTASGSPSFVTSQRQGAGPSALTDFEDLTSRAGSRRVHIRASSPFGTLVSSTVTSSAVSVGEEGQTPDGGANGFNGGSGESQQPPSGSQQTPPSPPDLSTGALY